MLIYINLKFIFLTNIIHVFVFFNHNSQPILQYFTAAHAAYCITFYFSYTVEVLNSSLSSNPGGFIAEIIENANSIP
jgi:hypothetical protein